MARLLAHMQEDFVGRTTTPRALADAALRWPRIPLALGLSALPALALFVLAWLGPGGILRAITDTQHVHDTFSRFVSGIATASSIAVSVAALTLRRELKGIESHGDRHEASEDYRRRVRARLDAQDLPVGLGDFLVQTAEGIARSARASLDAVRAHGTRMESGGVDLEEYLRALEARAQHAARALGATRYRPDTLLLAALDFEQDATTRLAHRYARAAPSALQEQLGGLRDLLEDFSIAKRFLKTLDTQWGLGRMSGAILLATLPSIVVASLMVLAYGPGAVAAWGGLGAAALVCAAFAVVLFPLACFVSYVLRFLFLNQHTLPTDGFVLGPEARTLHD